MTRIVVVLPMSY